MEGPYSSLHKEAFQCSFGASVRAPDVTREPQQHKLTHVWICTFEAFESLRALSRLNTCLMSCGSSVCGSEVITVQSEQMSSRRRWYSALLGDSPGDVLIFSCRSMAKIVAQLVS